MPVGSAGARPWEDGVGRAAPLPAFVSPFATKAASFTFEPGGMLIYTNNKGQSGEKLQQSWPSGCTGGVSGASDVGLTTEESAWVRWSYQDATISACASPACFGTGKEALHA